MKVLKEVASWILHITAAIAAGLLLNIFVFQHTLVQGSSMEPTLHDNDSVFLSKLAGHFNKVPEYNDIVVIDSRVTRPRSLKDDISDTLENNIVYSLMFKKPPNEFFWIKRVIGRPGDKIELRDGKVYRNGDILEETYTFEPMRLSSPLEVLVPEGHIFVLGDNRNHSGDSRDIGCVSLDHVLGKYIFRLKSAK